MREKIADDKRDPLEYVLNRLEHAGQSNAPAANGYGKHRKELLDGIADLRAKLAAAEQHAQAQFVAGIYAATTIIAQHKCKAEYCEPDCRLSINESLQVFAIETKDRIAARKPGAGQ